VKLSCDDDDDDDDDDLSDMRERHQPAYDAATVYRHCVTAADTFLQRQSTAGEVVTGNRHLADQSPGHCLQCQSINQSINQSGIAYVADLLQG